MLGYDVEQVEGASLAVLIAMIVTDPAITGAVEKCDGRFERLLAGLRVTAIGGHGPRMQVLVA